MNNNFEQFIFVGDFCKPCECNGNINTTVTGACNDITGICQECLYNTFGDHCERCEDWYYGDAIDAKNCRGKDEILLFYYSYSFIFDNFYFEIIHQKITKCLVKILYRMRM